MTNGERRGPQALSTQDRFHFYRTLVSATANSMGFGAWSLFQSNHMLEMPQGLLEYVGWTAFFLSLLVTFYLWSRTSTIWAGGLRTAPAIYAWILSLLVVPFFGVLGWSIGLFLVQQGSNPQWVMMVFGFLTCAIQALLMVVPHHSDHDDETL